MHEVAVWWPGSQTARPSRAATTSWELPSRTALVLPRQIPYTSGPGGRQLVQTRSETITACWPTGSTDTTRSPLVGRPVTGCTLSWSRSTTNGLGSLATSSRRPVRCRGRPASGPNSRRSAVVEGAHVIDGDRTCALGSS